MADKDCINPEEHCALHACQLNYKERNPEIEKIFENPRYVCANCGARVNNEENLCKPKLI
ncbi:hypothetical protein [Desulfuromonas sp. TF]|jgi:hypothetical protein|uniref:hypothetical protein n=1 Tax=Desulfuromonas sp. TF TaxID=1232410 RepID=UPI0003FA27B9|nr:hypothetical protein [Desulfuromonas sp. TF]